MIQIHRVPTPPARDAEPHPVVHALADVEAEVLRDLVGHDDFSESARARTARLFGSDYADQPHWVALADGDGHRSGPTWDGRVRPPHPSAARRTCDDRQM